MAVGLIGAKVGGVAEPGRRDARRAAKGNSLVDAPSVIPENLPVGRAASIIAVVLLAGALFGYDQGVISGALLGIQKAFDVGHVALEIVTSWVTLGSSSGRSPADMWPISSVGNAHCSPQRRFSSSARSFRPSRQTCRSSSLAAS